MSALPGPDGAPEPEPGESRMVVEPAVGASSKPLRVDRAHALYLVGEAADDMRDTLGRATQGLRFAGKAASVGHAAKARPGEVFELVTPEKLREGITNNTLRHATPWTGDASVLIKNAEDGRIAGRADLLKVGPTREVRPTPSVRIGPVAWQAMALATQQHYLVEISAKLDGIEQRVDELLARLDDDRIGTLKNMSEVAATAQVAARRDGRLSPERLQDLRRVAGEAKELWYQMETTAERQLGHYREGKTSAEEVTRTFAMLMSATRVLAQCSEALVAVPYHSLEELKAAVSEEQERLQPALPAFLGLCDGLLSASAAWQQRYFDYESFRPKNRVARALRVPAVEVRRVKGKVDVDVRLRETKNRLARGLPVPAVEVRRLKGKLDVDVRLRPEQRPLAETEQAQLRTLVASRNASSVLIVGEVQDDGTVLLGPAEDALRGPQPG
jgi:hypothetical protein